MEIKLLITMVSAGVITAVGEEICIALGKGDYAKWIKVGGTSFCIATGVGMIAVAVNKARSVFGL